METYQVSSSSSGSSLDIFLSFKGDTRKSFTDHLYRALCDAGFGTFRDVDAIQMGRIIGNELERAIQNSKCSVIVLSRHYGHSKWCLNELLMILERKRSDVRYEILPIFYHVTPEEVRDQKGPFKEAFDEYEEHGEHSKEKVYQWRKALKDVSKIQGIGVNYESSTPDAEWIETIVEMLGTILTPKVLAVASYTVGVESRVKDIDLWLKDPAGVPVGVIRGMRGIGKTTIAKVAYNLNFANFEATSFLANIREASQQQNGLLRLQNQLLSNIHETRVNTNYNGISQIHDATIYRRIIQHAICRKRILLILDDVDDIEQINALITSLDLLVEGSKIIITTSRERLLLISHQKHITFRIKELDDQESLELFHWHAFSEDCSMEGQGYLERILRYCGGLPLALKVVGSSLIHRRTDLWASALEKMEAIPDKRILKTLMVSYKALDDEHDKQLFLKIAWCYVGKDMDDVVKMLEAEDFYSKMGMQKLLDQFLISVDKYNNIVMHPSYCYMARAIVRDDPWEHDFSILKTEPTDQERPWSSFKCLCLDFFFLFNRATLLIKRLTGQSTSM